MNIDTTTLIVIGSILFSVLLVDANPARYHPLHPRQSGKGRQLAVHDGNGDLLQRLSRRRGSKGSSVAYPVVQYSYQVMGQMLQGRGVIPGPETGGSWAHKVVERYPAGAQVMVYYDPNNPSDAVLERGMPGYIKWLWVALILTDLFLCGMAVVMAFSL